MKGLPKWKLAILILLILAFVGFVVWCVIDELPEEDYGLEFLLSQDRSYCVVGSIGSCTESVVVIPSVYGYKPVKGIDSFAFSGFTALTSITIPDGVESIGHSAFAACLGLTDVTISASVQSIGDRAFYGCIALKTITFSGTKAQWHKIAKDDAWNSRTGDYTVHCTDGTISKANS